MELQQHPIDDMIIGAVSAVISLNFALLKRRKDVKELKNGNKKIEDL